jgi:putative nucleotide binding protein
MICMAGNSLLRQTTFRMRYHEPLTDGRRRERMAKESAHEEWVRTLTERPPDRDEEESRYVQTVGESRFALLELAVDANTDLSPGDRVAVESEDSIGVHRRLTYRTLTQAAQDRLEETIEEIIADNKQRFIDFYNNAQPIGLRKHQLDVLAGIGDTRRERIIDERRQGAFTDFADLEARVDSLHDPPALLVKCVLTELREADEVRYKLLVD